MTAMTCTLLGIGAMASPRYAPAGLLVEAAGARVAIDGGPSVELGGHLDAWLLTDDRGELAPGIRRRARELGIQAGVARFQQQALSVDPQPVVHTSHPAYGYLIKVGRRRIAWAPEFWRFPEWAAGADLMFAEASSWERPIRFAGGVGGHLPLVEVARRAQELGVRRLVFAHLGRPTLRALDHGRVAPFGEIGVERARYH